MRSACQSSIASIIADTFADATSTPLPCETDSEREFGRIAWTTGMPMESKPVTLASLRDADESACDDRSPPTCRWESGSAEYPAGTSSAGGNPDRRCASATLRRLVGHQSCGDQA